MKRVLKKILFISDDFTSCLCNRKSVESRLRMRVGPGNRYYKECKANWLKFNIDLIESFDGCKLTGYDAILVDYGLIDNTENMKKLKSAKLGGTLIAWVGGLGGSMGDWYNKDAKKMFPTFKSLHNLDNSDIDDDNMLSLLYRLFEKEKVEK